MIYIVEIWSVKPAWLALSTQERGAYMTQVGGAIQDLLAKGVKGLTWSHNDSNTSKRMDHDFFAIWTFPDQNLADDFLQIVEGAGWYEYFEQVNLKGNAASVEDIIGRLVAI